MPRGVVRNSLGSKRGRKPRGEKVEGEDRKPPVGELLPMTLKDGIITIDMSHIQPLTTPTDVDPQGKAPTLAPNEASANGESGASAQLAPVATIPTGPGGRKATAGKRRFGRTGDDLDGGDDLARGRKGRPNKVGNMRRGGGRRGGAFHSTPIKGPGGKRAPRRPRQLMKPHNKCDPHRGAHGGASRGFIDVGEIIEDETLLPLDIVGFEHVEVFSSKDYEPQGEGQSATEGSCPGMGNRKHKKFDDLTQVPPQG